ncbi:MAG: transglutaminaseTgpA domain-containing protein [Propionibacteriales bacterium]|nr:transglutaminaseTgpA domain-containing protein [Propionibacteriales bacterium]
MSSPQPPAWQSPDGQSPDGQSPNGQPPARPGPGQGGDDTRRRRPQAPYVRPDQPTPGPVHDTVRVPPGRPASQGASRPTGSSGLPKSPDQHTSTGRRGLFGRRDRSHRRRVDDASQTVGSVAWTSGRPTRTGSLASSLQNFLSKPRMRGLATIGEHTGPARLRWILIDSAAVLLLLAVATLAFRLTYGVNWLWVTCLGGAVLGIGLGVLGALRRFPTWIMAIGVAAVYLVFGSFLAMPDQATATVVPNLRTLRGLVLGVVQAPKQSLTIDAPIGETGSLLVVPLLTMLIAAVLAVSIGLRSGRPGLAWLPCAGAMLVGIAFGVQSPYLPALLGAAFFVVALVWTAHRRSFLRQSLLRQRRRFGVRSVASAAAVLLLSSGVAVAAQPVVDSAAPRQVLRDVVVPPLDVRAYPSPLQGFRANLKDHKKDVLYTVSGMPEGGALRLATLDAYDGRTFTVSNSLKPGPGTFKRIGTRVPEQMPGDPVQLRVTVNQGGGPFVPTIGQTTGLTFTGDRALDLDDNLFYNPATGTALDTAGLREGDTYTVDAVVGYQPAQNEFRESEPGSIEMPSAEQVPDEIKDRAQQWASAADSPGAVAIKLEAELRKGFYSNGLENDVPSLSGHSTYRLAKLITDNKGQMIGDEEQYATAMALMARELGLPSRVVYGYRPAGGQSGDVQITGADVSAWVEINFEKYGWVIFTPTPDKSRVPKPDDNPQEAKPRPQVENPPPPAERPEQPPPDNTPPQPSEEDPDDPDGINWRLVLIMVAVIGIPLLLLIAPIVTVLAIKARRRKKRMTQDSLTDRVAGGWAEMIDRARDLGAAPDVQATRIETATVLAEQFPQTDVGSYTPSLLARRADWATFGPTTPTDAQVAGYWDGVGSVVTTMGRSVGGWRRVRGALSLRSLRPPR